MCCAVLFALASAAPGFFLTNTLRIVETLLLLGRTADAKAWMAKALGMKPSLDDDETVPVRLQAARKKLGM